MAMKKNLDWGYGGGGKTPTIDGGLGLIIRLNILFNKADRAALAGDIDDWNAILDRVHVNLSYREPLDYEVINGKVTKLKLCEDDYLIDEKFLELLRNAKRRKAEAIFHKDRKKFEESKQELYNILNMKDKWLRKLMNEMNLYLKEIEFNAANALFGG